MSNCWFPVKVPPCQKEASELPVMTTPAPPVLLMAVAPPRSALDCSVTQIPPPPLSLPREGPAQQRLVGAGTGASGQVRARDERYPRPLVVLHGKLFNG